MRYSYLALIINILATAVLAILLGLGFVIFDRLVLGGRFSNLPIRIGQVNALVARLNETTAQKINLESQLKDSQAQLANTQQVLEALPGYHLDQVIKSSFSPSWLVMSDGRYTFDHVISFEKDSTQLGHKERQYLRQAAQQIQLFAKETPHVPWIIRVEGHTDYRPLKGNQPPPSYWLESYKRALAVTQYLITQGIDPRRIYPAGFSHYHPPSEQLANQNRRAVLRFDFLN